MTSKDTAINMLGVGAGMLQYVTPENKSFVAKLIDLARHVYVARNSAYHNLSHINGMLNAAYRLKSIQGEQLDATLTLAIWYHDIIHQPCSFNNEVDSSDFFKLTLLALGDPEWVDSESICALIEITSEHLTQLNLQDPRYHKDCSIILDADIVTLGQDYDYYLKNSLAIRKEYSCLTDEVYVNYRKDFLQKLVSRPRLFYTDYCFTNYEEQARSNILTELDSRFLVEQGR